MSIVMSESLPTIKDLDFSQLRALILTKTEQRTTLGYVDHSPLSYDWHQASARAYRVQQRVVYGRRLTRDEWRRELGIL